MNLKKIRKEKHYTQEQIAKILEVDRSTYTYMEIGKTKINHVHIIKLCKALECSADYLLGLIDEDLTNKTKKEE